MTDYQIDYEYSPIGNILSIDRDGVVTTYEYEGHLGNSYANPHAVTKLTNLTPITYSYDNNGNLLTDGTWTHTWDADNRLTSSTNGSITTTYTYDHSGQRTSKTIGTEVTTYPNDFFTRTVDGATTETETHIMDTTGTLVATVSDDGLSVDTHTIHTDHLGGTNVVTDETGVIEELTDYYPFGEQRISEGSYEERHKYTGHELDLETNLTYANARYYDQARGQWLSQDPISQQNPEQFLADPQQLNMYSYARNNPLVLVDQEGEASTRAALTNPIWYALIKVGASTGGGLVFGDSRPISTQLYNHSLTLNPSDVYMGPNSDYVGLIKNDEQYQEKFSRLLQKQDTKGKTSFFQEKIGLVYEPGDGELKSAISRVDLYVNGQINNGVWDVEVTGVDTYDFGFNKSDWNEGFFGIAANISNFLQKAELVSEFDVKIEFQDSSEENETRMNKRKKKNKSKRK